MSSASDKPLTVPLLVRGAVDRTLVGGLSFVAALMVVVGVIGYLASGDVVGLGICLALAAFFAAPAALIIVILWPQRRWLEVTLTGFVITQRGQRKIYADDQVGAIWLDYRVTAEGVTRWRIVLEVGTDEDAEQIDGRYTALAELPDPLASFLDRLVSGLARRSRAALAEGGAIAGKGWRLDARGLHWQGQVVGLERITLAGVYKDRLCVWKDDDERPFARIPAGSRNARVLAVLLAEQVSVRPGHSRPLPGQPLGRILLERRGHDRALGCLTLLVFGPAMALLLWLDDGEAGLAGLPLDLDVMFLSPTLVLGVLLLWRGWSCRLRFHEFGLVHPDGKHLLYEEIGTLTWKGVGDFVVLPLPGLDRPAIRYHNLRAHAIADLIRIRDHIAGLIARRWADELKRGPVPWTPRLRFLPGALEYRPTELFGSSEPVTVPYHFIRWRIEAARFLLFVPGQSQPVVRESFDTPNLFAGIALLEQICQGLHEPDTQAPVAPAAPPDERFTERK